MKTSDLCRKCGELLASDHASVDRTGCALCYHCEKALGVVPALVARFWFSWRGAWVKLTLRPYVQDTSEGLDQAVYLQHYEPNDEGGGCRTCETVWLRDGKIIWDRETRSRDCDGVFESSDRLVCSLADLASREPYDLNDETYCPEPGAKLPAWEKEGRGWQRDHAAEAAGY